MKETPKAQPEASVPLPLPPPPAPALVVSTETLECFADDVGSLWCTPRIPVLEEPPSSLDFLRDFVSKSRPCIIQHAISAENNNGDDSGRSRNGPPLLLSLDDLLARMEGVDVVLDVNATPDGHGDCLRRVAVPAPVPAASNARARTNSNGSTADDDEKATNDESCIIDMFVEPELRHMSFPQFRDRLRAKRKAGRVIDENIAERIFHPTLKKSGVDGSKKSNSENVDNDVDTVLYYSVQNDCLRADLPSLWDAGIFPTSFDWAEQAFGVGPPDAVNLWVGNERAVSSMHKDHYENLFYVVSGEKVFTVCPPADAPFLYERECPAGIFVSSTRDGGDWRVQQQKQQQQQQDSPDNDAQSVPAKVRWIAANVQHKNNEQHMLDYPLLAYTHPITITVQAGEMLYLPALWFHSVTQTKETVAMNYWYDMQFDSPAWCYFHFLSQMQPAPPPPPSPPASARPNAV